MKSKTASHASSKTPGAANGISWRTVARFAVVLLLTPIALFGAAGRLDWPMGWVYVGMVFLFAIASRLIALRTSPDMLAERARSLHATDVKPWDRAIVPFIAVYGPLAMLIVAGLDHRYAWSPPTSSAIQSIALAVIVLGYAFGTWAMAVNRFFSAFVRIQTDRQHVPVTGGPYRIVRHPAYASSIAINLAVPVMLGSLWALVPGALTSLIVIVRAALEDGTLQAELPGYVEYTRRTRYRLLPGVW